ncbi:uncharacterized protein FOMMEDRAFT_116604 [Fomitiporia mediterranea MF3/22]|uniref:uncharacterized protein n=1 Tax=Fomitiporia mediterranea (strain MF3/22) TaxID=694068 RepID=UPI000440843D|nr:uncharacterized protein FOMMEDRAFT_116604 [Fomitiporia mediterranea MF3/22]EJD08149.1 hypothetical protein FOMMEDRAFT_116604 [Fomitiporia mediterranea MF3/22]
MIRPSASSGSRSLYMTASRHKVNRHAHAIGRRAMSARPEEPKQVKEGDAAPRRKVTIQRLQQMKEAGTPIAMVTAYDYPTGRACEAYGVDITLVGDSLAQVCLGYDSTTRLTLPEMLHHIRAVSRGSKNPFLVADMPFGSYHSGPEDATRNAARMVQEAGVEGVKLEGGEEILDSVHRLTRVGIPVMAHVGLLPQRHVSSSGYRVQGKDAASAKSILRAAQALEDAGAFSIVLEAIPSKLAEYITKRLRIPTIGIGAGPATDGQVLVWDDMMGTWNGHKAKFVRRFADAKAEHKRGVLDYVEAVRQRSFPDETESYGMDENQWKEFLCNEGL